MGHAVVIHNLGLLWSLKLSKGPIPSGFNLAASDAGWTPIGSSKIEKKIRIPKGTAISSHYLGFETERPTPWSLSPPALSIKIPPREAWSNIKEQNPITLTIQLTGRCRFRHGVSLLNWGDEYNFVTAE